MNLEVSGKGKKQQLFWENFDDESCFILAEFLLESLKPNKHSNFLMMNIICASCHTEMI